MKGTSAATLKTEQKRIVDGAPSLLYVAITRQWAGDEKRWL
jgi:hypothetical protein